MWAHLDKNAVSTRSAHVSITLGVYSTPIFLSALALCLAIAHFLTLTHSFFGNPVIIRMFDMNAEANVPTWFSSSLWLTAALLSFSIFQKHGKMGYTNGVYWGLLAAVSLFLSIDEAAQFHEAVGSAIGKTLEGSQVLQYTYASAIFTSIVFAAVGIFFLSFLLKLQGRFRFLILASAVLFVSGAVIVESIGAAVDAGVLARFPLGQSWPRMIVYEELLEMLGVILLIHTLLRILALDEAPYERPQATSQDFRGSSA